MASFNNLRIGTRQVISMTTLVMLLILAISGIIAYRVQHSLRENTKSIIQESAYHSAYIIKTELDIALSEARALANMVESVVNTTEDIKLSHQRVNDSLKYFLGKRPRFFGVKLAFESYNSEVGTENMVELGYNNSGVFAPHWVHDTENKISSYPLVNYDTTTWYQFTQKNLRESVIDPTIYTTSRGEPISLITLAVPVLGQKNQFIGVLAIDFATQNLYDVVRDLSSEHFQNTFSTIYSANGTVIANKLEHALGKNIRDTSNDQEFISKVLSNKAFFMEQFLDVIKKMCLVMVRR